MGIKRIKIAVLGLILGLLIGCTSSAAAGGTITDVGANLTRTYDADYGVVCYSDHFGGHVSGDALSCVQVHAPNK